MKNMNLSRSGEKNGMFGIKRYGSENPFFGKKHTEETKRKISNSKKGTQANEKHPSWRGDKASYDAIHAWIRKHKGTPNVCELCGKNKHEGIIHWANINHLYTRNFEDYIGLCAKCHWDYDKKYNNKKTGINKKRLRDLHLS